MALTAAAIAFIVVGVSRTLLVLGLVGRENEGGLEGDEDYDDDRANDGSESSVPGRRARHGHARRRQHGAHRAAAQAQDEGELWARPRWMEGAGGDGDGDSWEDGAGGGEWDDGSAAVGETLLYDSGADQ